MRIGSRGRIATFGLRASLLLGLSVPSLSARAQITEEPTEPYPDPSLFSRGLYLEAEGGATIPLGSARDAIDPGAAIGLRVGYELWRFFALELHALSSLHTVNQEGAPLSAQLLQITRATADLKLALPLGPFSIFAAGGGGRARFSTNVLATTGHTAHGVRLSWVMGGHLGLDYHSRSRHFSTGVTGGFHKLDRLATTGLVTAAAYLRYTF